MTRSQADAAFSAPFLASLSNMVLRSMTLVSRFALTLFIAKFMGIAEVGAYGLVVGLVSMTPVVVGWGANYFMSRSSVGESRVVAGQKLKDRLVLTLLSLLAAFILGLTAIKLGIISEVSFLLPTLVIILFETLACDIQAWLVARHMTLHSNALLFIRSSLWALIMMTLAYFSESYRELGYFIKAWAVFEVLQVFPLLFFLRKWPLKEIARAPVDTTRIKEYVTNGKFIYWNEIGLVGTLYLDRFIINGLLGLDLTGIYTFYWSIANGVNALIVTGIIQITTPHMVQSVKDRNFNLWQQIFSKLLQKTLFSTLLLSVVILGVLSVVLPMMRVGEFGTYWPLAAMLMAANILRLLSSCANSGLSSQYLDTHFASIGLMGLVLSLVLNAIFIYFWGLYGVAGAAIMTHAILFLAKFRILKREGRQE